MNNTSTQTDDHHHIRITPELASMLDDVSRRHDKPPEILMDMAIRAMHATIPKSKRTKSTTK